MSHFLLVNDDGIGSKPMQALCRALAARGHRVTVSAPQTQQSGKSHSFTIFDPVRVRKAEVEGAEAAWAVAGTPVDCARLGLMQLAEKPVDLVISGINDGMNVGTATYVSGTVGAAREAAFMQGRAMAVSIMMDAPEETLLFFCEWIATAAERLLTYDAPWGSVVNINAPMCPVRELKPPAACPISLRMYRDTYERRESPRGDIYYWLSEMQPFQDPEPDRDLGLLLDNHITCTFLTPEPTEQSRFQEFLDTM